MCDVLAQAMADVPEPSRRSLLKGAGAVGLGAAASVFGARPAQAATASAAQASRGASRHRTRLVLLGTAGGPVA